MPFSLAVTLAILAWLGGALWGALFVRTTVRMKRFLRTARDAAGLVVGHEQTRHQGDKDGGHDVFRAVVRYARADGAVVDFPAMAFPDCPGPGEYGETTIFGIRGRVHRESGIGWKRHPVPPVGATVRVKYSPTSYHAYIDAPGTFNGPLAIWAVAFTPSTPCALALTLLMVFGEIR